MGGNTVSPGAGAAAPVGEPSGKGGHVRGAAELAHRIPKGGSRALRGGPVKPGKEGRSPDLGREGPSARSPSPARSPAGTEEFR